VDFHRSLATVLLVAATILTGVAIHGPWWQASRISTSELSPGQIQDVQVYFKLDGSISCSTYGGWTSNPCQNISSSISGSFGLLYSAIDYTLYGLLAAGVAAAVCLGAGIMGYSFGRTQFTLTLVASLVVGVAALGFSISSVALGPGSQAAGYCAALSGDQASCSFFWGGTTAGVISGSCIECLSSFGWGSGVSWDTTTAAGALALFGWYLLWRGRHGPFTKGEQEAWAAANRPYSLSNPPPGPSTTTPGLPAGLTAPTGRSAIPFSATRTTRWTCRRCRTVNSPWAMHCGACGDSRPEGP
jgi:hypothetical protein